MATPRPPHAALHRAPPWRTTQPSLPSPATRVRNRAALGEAA